MSRRSQPRGTVPALVTNSLSSSGEAWTVVSRTVWTAVGFSTSGCLTGSLARSRATPCLWSVSVPGPTASGQPLSLCVAPQKASVWRARIELKFILSRQLVVLGFYRQYQVAISQPCRNLGKKMKRTAHLSWSRSFTSYKNKDKINVDLYCFELHPVFQMFTFHWTSLDLDKKDFFFFGHGLSTQLHKVYHEKPCIWDFSYACVIQFFLTPQAFLTQPKI